MDELPHDLPWYSAKVADFHKDTPLKISDGHIEDRWYYKKWTVERPMDMWEQDRVLFYTRDFKKVFVVCQGIPWEGKDQHKIYIYTGLIGLDRINRFAKMSGRL